MAKRERILLMGITGSGKSFQWMKMAKHLKDKGSIFRVIDTDSSIEYMLEEQFPELLPENGGNVYVYDAFDWNELINARRWARQEKLNPSVIATLDKHLKHAYNQHIKPQDWLILDMADRPWEAVQEYYVEETFGQDYGDFFLHVRKEIESHGGKNSQGKDVASLDKEAMDGWKDWTVINKLYKTWFNPITYQTKCHVILVTKVKEVAKGEKDAEIVSAYGDMHVMPVGQKHIGHTVHSIFLLYPKKVGSKDREYGITTIKDRSGRTYYQKDTLTNFYLQYLVSSAGWDL